MENVNTISLKNVYHAIRQKRLEKQLNLFQMAQKLSISEKAYSHMERGLTALTLDRFLHVAEILDVHPFDLMDDQKEKLSRAS